MSRGRGARRVAALRNEGMRRGRVMKGAARMKGRPEAAMKWRLTPQ